MNLPGEPLRVTDSGDLCIFLQDICEPCKHQEYCSILAMAGMYGNASEWRTVEGKPVCIRQEALPVIDMSIEGLERNDSVLVSILSLVGIILDESVIETWTDEQYWQASDWAGAVHLAASDNDDIVVSEPPEFLLPLLEVGNV